METSALSSDPVVEPEPLDSSERDEARKRVQARRDFVSHLVAYVVINAFLIAVWAFSGSGYFWPQWVIAGWGIGVVLNAWSVFFRRPITESDVEAELRRWRP